MHLTIEKEKDIRFLKLLIIKRRPKFLFKYLVRKSPLSKFVKISNSLNTSNLFA